MEEEVSCRPAACSEAPSATDWLAAETWAAAEVIRSVSSDILQPLAEWD